MSMLAERKQKVKWSLNPRGNEWGADSNKFGQKLLEKMGWNKGKGLGRNQDGITDIIKVSYKNDSKGMGFKESNDQWTEHEDKFSALLQNLGSSSDNLDSTKPQSLEEKSKTSRARVHYHKFTRGKDLSRYSSKDLANIFGRKELTKQTQPKEEPEETNENGSSELFVAGGSMVDYFKKKLPASSNTSNGYIVGSNGVLKKEEDEDDIQPSGFGFGFKEEKPKPTFISYLEEETNGPKRKREDDDETPKKKKKKSKKNPEINEEVTIKEIPDEQESVNVEESVANLEEENLDGGEKKKKKKSKVSEEAPVVEKKKKKKKKAEVEPETVWNENPVFEENPEEIEEKPKKKKKKKAEDVGTVNPAFEDNLPEETPTSKKSKKKKKKTKEIEEIGTVNPAFEDNVKEPRQPLEVISEENEDSEEKLPEDSTTTKKKKKKLEETPVSLGCENPGFEEFSSNGTTIDEDEEEVKTKPVEILFKVKKKKKKKVEDGNDNGAFCEGVEEKGGAEGGENPYEVKTKKIKKAAEEENKTEPSGIDNPAFGGNTGEDDVSPASDLMLNVSAKQEEKEVAKAEPQLPADFNIDMIEKAMEAFQAEIENDLNAAKDDRFKHLVGEPGEAQAANSRVEGGVRLGFKGVKFTGRDYKREDFDNTPKSSYRMRISGDIVVQFDGSNLDEILGYGQFDKVTTE